MTEEEKILREHAWSYFALVAQQRLSVINFYFLIATGLSAGMMALFKDSQTLNPISIGVLGILLIALSLIFWLWDRRNKEFVDNAVNVLKKYAKKDISNNIRLSFPLTEPEIVKPNFASLRFYPNFSSCLRYLYFLFSAIGVIGIIFSIYKGKNDIVFWWWIPMIPIVAGVLGGSILYCCEQRKKKNTHEHG
ncbi:MAG: hypothetical protein RBT87_09765 [bacterium]|jgi:hypothetical protein|nr:hypothetical protein [bacterium]